MNLPRAAFRSLFSTPRRTREPFSGHPRPMAIGSVQPTENDHVTQATVFGLTLCGFALTLVGVAGTPSPAVAFGGMGFGHMGGFARAFERALTASSLSRLTAPM
jgi:hypothetical protein